MQGLLFPYHTLPNGLMMEVNQKWMFLGSLESISIEMYIVRLEGDHTVNFFQKFI